MHSVSWNKSHLSLQDAVNKNTEYVTSQQLPEICEDFPSLPLSFPPSFPLCLPTSTQSEGLLDSHLLWEARTLEISVTLFFLTAHFIVLINYGVLVTFLLIYSFLSSEFSFQNNKGHSLEFFVWTEARFLPLSLREEEYKHCSMTVWSTPKMDVKLNS